jgi:hypothetical protein
MNGRFFSRITIINNLSIYSIFVVCSLVVIVWSLWSTKRGATSIEEIGIRKTGEGDPLRTEYPGA